MSTTTDTAVLDALLDPFAASLTPEAARSIADYRADEKIQLLLDDLADKANEGLLSEQERNLYESYINVIDVIAILQAKARRVLAARRC